ncbi:MAG: VanZ family protein [Campylobacterota bacterium]|nr:VanZ family protein [Campylobacterota bacterium]
MPYENRKSVKTLFWIALVGSYILAVMPHDSVPKLTPFNDKGNHFIAFSILTILILHAYRIKYFWASALMLFYGIFIETSQLFAVNRSGELLDVLADTIGIFGGVIIYFVTRKVYLR